MSSASGLIIKFWSNICKPSILELFIRIAKSSVTVMNRRVQILHPCLMPLSTLNLGHVPSGKDTQLLMSVNCLKICYQIQNAQMFRK